MGLKKPVLRNYQQLTEIAKAGRAVWLEDIPGIPSEYWIPEIQKGDYLMENGIDFQTEGKNPEKGDYLMENGIYFQTEGKNQEKVASVRKKLYEILLSLNPLEYDYFKLTERQNVIIDISSLLEKSFSEEITAHYFFHLYFDYEFSARFSSPMRSFSSTKNSNRLPDSLRPKDCLLSILQNDKDKINSLGEWFYRWIQDISNLGKETSETLDKITRQIDEYR